jgi:hypothetical protein
MKKHVHLKTVLVSLVALAGVASMSASAQADNDGVSRFNAGDAAVPGVYVDVGANSIDRAELSTGVKAELDQLRTDTDTNTTTNTNQQASIDDHEARITTGEAKNVEQDGRLDGHDTTLTLHSTQIAQGVAHDAIQDGRLGSLENVTAGHTAALNAHSALLSDHSAKLEDHSRGLAIAMAMPDAWLSDKKKFGIFGAVGGFDDETAMGFAAIGRLDETWSLNAKVGTDFEGKNFGWQVGAGAQW